MSLQKQLPLLRASGQGPPFESFRAALLHGMAGYVRDLQSEKTGKTCPYYHVALRRYTFPKELISFNEAIRMALTIKKA
jgi:hypothetical protein